MMGSISIVVEAIRYVRGSVEAGGIYYWKRAPRDFLVNPSLDSDLQDVKDELDALFRFKLSLPRLSRRR